MYMPIGILGVSVATAAIPELARHATEQKLDVDADHRVVGPPHDADAVRAGDGRIDGAGDADRRAAVRARGVRRRNDTSKVARALLFYAPGHRRLLDREDRVAGFYSLQDARTPVLVSLATIATNLALNLWLNSVMGFRGLALGTAITANINAGLLLWLLSRRLGGVDAQRVATAFVKIAIASLLMGAASYGTELWLHDARSPASGGARDCCG